MDFQDSKPRNVEDIFHDFSGRRLGLIRALTQDFDELCSLCDPGKEKLCLYGLPNESWKVTLPVEFLPPDIPEPFIGINSMMDGMDSKQWRFNVALYSDSWLLSVAFYNGALLNCTQRDHLFSLINDLPTVHEIVIGKIPVKDCGSGSKTQGTTMRSTDGKVKSNPKSEEEENNENDLNNVSQHEEDEDEIVCGICNGNDNGDEFWIGCDVCEEWFHGKCVKITPGKAKRIKKYRCASCSIKW